MPLTREQFIELRNKGLSQEQIVNFEKESSNNKSKEDKENSNDNSFDKKALTATAIAGLAFGAKEFLFQPAHQIELRENELRRIAKNQLGEPNISKESVPSRIIRSGELKKAQLQSGLSELKRSLYEFDENVLSKNVNDFSDYLTVNTPKFFNETYNMYGSALDKIDDELIKSGKSLDYFKFTQDVIKKTIDDSISSGVPEDKLDKMVSFMKSTSQASKKESIKQLKGYVKSLEGDIPKEATFRLKENWGNFLENNAPEAKDRLNIINRDYRKVRQIRTALYKTIDQDTGVYDKTKLNKMLTAYAKSKVRTGLEESIKIISEGTSISPKQSGIKSQFEQFKSASGQRSAIVNKSRDLQRNIEQSKLNTLKWLDKSERLLAEMGGIAERHPIRAFPRTKGAVRAGSVATHAGLSQIVKRSLGVLGIYPMISGAVKAFYDPEQAIAEQMGIQIPDKGTKERAVIENLSTGEPIPEGMEISEEERNNILFNYGLAL